MGVQQVAIGGLDKNILTDFWVDKMGIKKIGSYRGEVRLSILIFLIHLDIVMKDQSHQNALCWTSTDVIATERECR